MFTVFFFTKKIKKVKTETVEVSALFVKTIPTLLQC